MKKPFDIVIVGGGMVGLTVAILLAGSEQRDRLRMTVIDVGSRPEFDPDDDVGLRVSAISLGSAEILRSAEVWEPIQNQRSCSYRRMRVWDARAAVESPETLRFDAADFAVPELGFIVENALIRRALFDRASATDIECRFDTGIDRLIARQDAGGYTVVLQDGSTLSPELLIGADGARSFVREEAGIPTRAWQYPQSALVTHVVTEAGHRRTAWQRFLKEGPIALLPLADGRASVVWSTAPGQAEDAMAASDDALGAMLTRASDSVLGDLTVAGPRGSFPLRAQHALRYIEPGLALIGDAAHSVHPLAGQGANLGFADASGLADAVLQGLAADEYPGDAPTLRRYERARKGANGTMLRFVDSINRLFLADTAGLSGLRRGGMRLFNRSGPLRRRAVQVALGINV